MGTWGLLLPLHFPVSLLPAFLASPPPCLVCPCQGAVMTCQGDLGHLTIQPPPPTKWLTNCRGCSFPGRSQLGAELLLPSPASASSLEAAASSPGGAIRESNEKALWPNSQGRCPQQEGILLEKRKLRPKQGIPNPPRAGYQMKNGQHPLPETTCMGIPPTSSLLEWDPSLPEFSTPLPAASPQPPWPGPCLRALRPAPECLLNGQSPRAFSKPLTKSLRGRNLGLLILYVLPRSCCAMLKITNLKKKKITNFSENLNAILHPPATKSISLSAAW